MRTIFQGTIVATLIGMGCATSALQGAPAQSQVRLENGSILYAELTKTVDAKKAKRATR